MSSEQKRGEKMQQNCQFQLLLKKKKKVMEVLNIQASEMSFKAGNAWLKLFKLSICCDNIAKLMVAA